MSYSRWWNVDGCVDVPLEKSAKGKRDGQKSHVGVSDGRVHVRSASDCLCLRINFTGFGIGSTTDQCYTEFVYRFSRTMTLYENIIPKPTRL